MNLEDIQQELSTALQLDLEQGVAWMNDEAAKLWQTEYPTLNEVIGKILDLDTEGLDLQEYKPIEY